MHHDDGRHLFRCYVAEMPGVKQACIIDEDLHLCSWTLARHYITDSFRSIWCGQVDSDGQREYPEMSKEQVADLIFDRAVGK